LAVQLFWQNYIQLPLLVSTEPLPLLLISRTVCANGWAAKIDLSCFWLLASLSTESVGDTNWLKRHFDFWAESLKANMALLL
jgi:hypothetical protein